MSRWLAFVLGSASLLAAGAALGQSPARAQGKDLDDARRIVRFSMSGAYLGVVLEEVEGGTRGVRVKNVEGDTPAAKAGLKAGDVIVRFDGESIRSAAHLRRVIQETPAGRSVAIEVTRDGAPHKLTATLEEGKGKGPAFADAWGKLAPFAVPAPPEPPEAPEVPEVPEAPQAPSFRWPGGDNAFRFDFEGRGPRKLGIRYQPISGQLAKYFRVADDEGVLVVSVDEDGPAAKAGMKAGDVILKIDGKAVRDEDDVRRSVRALESGKEATVSVQRDGKPLELKITVGSEKSRRKGIGTTT
jgi:serine protease Do